MSNFDIKSNIMQHAVIYNYKSGVHLGSMSNCDLSTSFKFIAFSLASAVLFIDKNLKIAGEG